MLEFGTLLTVLHTGFWLINNMKVGTDLTLYSFHICLPTLDLTSTLRTLISLERLVSSLLTAGFAAVHASHQSE